MNFLITSTFLSDVTQPYSVAMETEKRSDFQQNLEILASECNLSIPKIHNLNVHINVNIYLKAWLINSNNTRTKLMLLNSTSSQKY